VPTPRFELVNGVDDGSSDAIERVMQPMGVPGVSFGSLRDGKILENRDYWNGKLLEVLNTRGDGSLAVRGTPDRPPGPLGRPQPGADESVSSLSGMSSRTAPTKNATTAGIIAVRERTTCAPL